MPPAIKHIVLADDDTDDVQLFQEAIFETCPDVNLVIATDGVKLLHLLKEMPKPDIILLDLNMPRKSGQECLTAIRANDDFNDVPIVILSTSNQREDIDECLKKRSKLFFYKAALFSWNERYCSEYLHRSV